MTMHRRHLQLSDAIFGAGGGLKLRFLPDSTLRTVLGQPPALPGPFLWPAPPRGAGAGAGRGAAVG